MATKKIHPFDVECPPEGLPLWAAANRWPGTKCCPPIECGPEEWEGSRGRIIGMPGETHDVFMTWYDEEEQTWKPSGHVIRIHFRQPDGNDDLADFKWVPKPEKATVK